MAPNPTWTAQWDQAKWAVNEHNSKSGDSFILREVLDASTAAVCENPNKHIFKKKFLILVDTSGNSVQRTYSATVSETCENMDVVKALEAFYIINF